MSGTIPWIIIGLVFVYMVWRLMTARTRARRNMFERMTRSELENLDIEQVRREGLEDLYREVLAKKQHEGQ